MRSVPFVLALGAVAVVGACGVFGGDEPSTVSPEGDDGGASGVDGAGPADAVGRAADDELIIEPIGEPVAIVQGATVKVKVTLRRGKDVKQPVTITTAGLRDGVASAPLVITGDTGELEISAPVGAAQGAADGTIVGVAGAAKASTPLKTLVRGKPGDVDTTFATAGITTVFGSSAPKIVDLVLAPDDSVYVVAQCAAMTDYACVTHLTAAGAIDAGYGTNGVGLLTFKAPRAAALQPDGKLVVVGGNATVGAFVGRLDATGKPDATFGQASVGPGTQQVGTAGLNGQTHGAYGVSVRADGDIFVAWDNFDTAASAYKTGSMRLAPDASFRTAYGLSGTARSGLGLTTAITVRNDPASPSKGNVAMIFAEGSGATAVLGMFQFDGDTATADAQFGTVPKKVTVPGAQRSFGSAGAGLVQLADGSIVTAVNGNGGVYLRKLTPTGEGAVGFGSAGLAGPFPLDGGVTGIAVQPDGKIVIALDLGFVEFGLQASRFTSTGTMDTDFGTNGSITKIFGAGTLGRRVVVQKGGRILFSADRGDLGDGAVLAYWP